MKKSVNSWMFPRTMALAEMARAVRAAGFDAMEVTADAEGELTIASDETTCRKLAGQIREAGLEVASLACGLFWGSNYASPDAADRAKARELTLAALDRAQWMGTDAIWVVPAVVSHFERPAQMVCGYAEAMRLTYEALRELAPEAEARGVVIAIENVWNGFLLSPVEMRDLIDRVNSPWVGVYLDVGNVVKLGFPQDWIDILGQRIVRIHLKDFKADVGNLSGFCPLTEGDVDWPAVMVALKRVGYDGPLTYETYGGTDDLDEISERVDRILSDA